jgi:hypothetical protein
MVDEADLWTVPLEAAGVRWGRRDADVGVRGWDRDSGSFFGVRRPERDELKEMSERLSG